jgi:hypothetical protein
LRRLFLIILIALLAGTIACNKTNLPTNSNPGNVTSLSTPIGPLKGGEMLNGIIGLTASPLALDQDNILWIGTYSSIVAFHDNQFQTFDLYNTRIPHAGGMRQVLVDNSNKKWFVNGWGEVFTFDNQKWEVLPTPEKIRSIIAIRQDNAGTIWVLGQKEYVPNSGKTESVFWSYKDGSVGQILPNNFLNTDPADFIIDKNNNFWFLVIGGIQKYDGRTWEDLTSSLPMRYVQKIAYDEKNNFLYLFSNRLVNASGVISEGGITRFKDGKFEVIATEQTGLPASQYVYAFAVDNAGDIWMGYDQKPTSLARFDGKQWSTFGPITPSYLGSRVQSIVQDKNGRIWLGGSTASPQGACLTRLDGNTLTTYPILVDDPRTWWRKMNLAELYKLPVAKTDIQEALKDPISHRGEKIRVIASFESSFEYVNFVDMNGNKLNMWPDSNLELNKFLDSIELPEKSSGSGQILQKTGLKELIGFLEFGGGYGHMGGWPYRFYITEYYPYSNNEQENKKVHDLFASYISTLGQDDKAIRSIIARWTSALKTGDTEEMMKVYSPGNQRYKSLLTTAGQDYVKNNKMDINIKDMSIIIQRDSARVNILEATVSPDKYFTPTGNVRVIGDGLYKLRSIDLVKYNNEWKINNFDYSPVYEPPSIPAPKPSSP